MAEKKSRVLLCVTGSVAAYRAADLARELMRSGASVRVCLTESARRFVTTELFTALTGQEALSDLWQEPLAHIHFAREADLFLCAPCSAHTIAKFAHGRANDLVAALFLAYRGPVLVAPAMNPAMWEHPAVRANLATMRSWGIRIVEPGEGDVVAGETGLGKLAPIEQIVSEALAMLRTGQSLAGKHIVVTAGGTREPIDPVRFIGNRSSGKMGYAIARAAQQMGARVTLISAPTALAPPFGVTVLGVETAAEMAAACEEVFPACDAFIGVAAVSDFRAKDTRSGKVKREDGLALQLEPTEDILASLGAKKQKQVLIGFAAETGEVLANAKAKMAAKRLDMIVANDVLAPGAGFEVDTNQVTFLFSDGTCEALPVLSKDEVAARLVERIASLIPATS